MEKRWLISAVISAAALSMTACTDDESKPQETETTPYCESAICPEGTTCSEERRMCVTNPPKEDEDDTNPCDECTDNQKCVENTCVDINPCDECTDNQKCVENACVDINPCDRCTDDQECVENTCVDKEVDPPEKLCEETDAPKCNGNAVVSCVNGELVPKDCEDMECVEGECVEKQIDPNACDPAEFEPSCEENSFVSCVEGQLHTEPCPEGQYCDGGTCYETDFCPDNPDKMVPGVCGCAMPDTDLDESGTADCLNLEDLCPDDPEKTNPGKCGCGVSEDACGTEDLCPNNEEKTVPGVCGCDAADTDTDGDGIPDCLDKCPDNPYKFIQDECSCDLIHVSIDETGYCATPIVNAKEFVNIINDIAGESLEVTADSVYALMRNINLAEALTDETPVWKPVTFIGKLTSGGNTPKTIGYTNAEGERMTLHCAETDAACGLFGKLSGARIHNINLNLSVSGLKSIGGLAGTAEANTKLTQINANTDITAAGSDIGGVIGNGNKTSLSGITHQGKIVNIGENTTAAPVANTGGIAGRLANYSIVSDSKNIGQVLSESENISARANYLGGIVGYADTNTSLFNLTNDSVVSSLTTYYVGGIAGVHALLSASGNKNLVNNGYIKGFQSVGGLFGQLNSVSGIEGITDSVNHGTVVGLWQYTGGIAGYSYLPLTRVINDGTVSGSTYVGGISGIQNNSVNYALNNATIWAENAAQGCGTFIGGLFGQLVGGYAHSYLTNHGHIKADWAPRMAVNSTTGVQNADDCPNRYFAGIAGYISDGKGTKITNALNTGNLSTSMAGLGRSGGISGWAHTLSLINAKNTGMIKGSSLSGGIIGRLLIRGKAANKNFPFEMKNVENTGNIVSNGDRVGGIIGDLDIENEQAEYSFDQLLNNGTISSSASRIGGIIGNIRANNLSASFKNLYNIGNIKGASYIGGIVGYFNSNLEDFWEGESFNYSSTTDRTMTYTFDGGYSTGNVTGSGSYIGGLYGYIDLNAISASGGTQATVNCPKNTNIYTRQLELTYHNVTTSYNIKNMYSSGNVTETGSGSSTGGIAGGIQSKIYQPSYQNQKVVFSDTCVISKENTTKYTVTNMSEVNIQNTYYLGTITSDHATTGTLFGKLIQSDNVDATNPYKVAYLKTNDGKSSISNLYSAAKLANKGSAVAGNNDSSSLLNISNVYAWADGNPNKLVWGNSKTLSGYAEFTFNDAGVAMVSSTKVIDKLNAAVASLGLSTWKDASYTLPDSKAVTIPSLVLKPQLTAWEPWEGK